MGRWTGLINLALAGFCVYFGLQIVDVWEENGPATQTAQAAPTATPTMNPDGLPPSRPVPPETAYAVIVDRNLFSPDRTGPEADEEEPEAPAKVRSAPTGVGLFGVMILKDVKKALVDDIDGSDNRPSQWVQEGETVRGWTVEAIGKDRITLSSANGTHDVSLYDRRKRRTAGKSDKKGPTVVNTGAEAKRDVPSANEPEQAPTKPKPSEGQSSEKQPEPPASESSAAPPKPSKNQMTSQDDGPRDPPKTPEYEVIKTPFGEIRRKIR